MIVLTIAVLAVVGFGIWQFAKWSKKEKDKRQRDVDIASSLKK
jgi:hypothetical protein